LATGSAPRGETIQAVTLDKDGQYFFNREQVDLETLEGRLFAFAEDQDLPTLYVAVEAQGAVDRGPILIDLIERIQVAGIRNFAIVGQPGGSSGID
jgi:biopolymer transport protein ExbD